jgi:hypothetical protein
VLDPPVQHTRMIEAGPCFALSGMAVQRVHYRHFANRRTDEPTTSSRRNFQLLAEFRWPYGNR